MVSGPSGSASHFGRLPHHALVRQRQHVGEGEGGGIAGTGFLADAGAVEDRDVAPGLGEIGRRADADDAAADDGDVDRSLASAEAVAALHRPGIRTCTSGSLISAASSADQSETSRQLTGSFGRTASASLTIFSTALRRSPDSGLRGMRTRSLVPIASTSASLMFWTR